MWKITKDHICNGDDDNIKSSNFKEDVKLPFEFKMYDDDGELYYEGKTNYNYTFAPLDDFGMPNAGCTDIKYIYDGNKWKSL